MYTPALSSVLIFAFRFSLFALQIPTPHPRACLVLCMAGLYQRFRDAGFTTPKFLLPWHGTPLIEHILGHMLDPAAFDAIFCVANKRAVAGAAFVQCGI